MQGTYELAASGSSSGFNPTTLLILVVIVVVFYMFLIRPQQRRKQQAQQQKNTIQPGARVRTTAGMYATVVAVDGDDVILEVAPGVETRYMKRAIMDVVSPGETVDEPVDDEAPDDDETDAADYADDTTDEAAETDADDVEEADEADDADETAYERATGTKKE